jgi:hypothetical protein
LDTQTSRGGDEVNVEQPFVVENLTPPEIKHRCGAIASAAAVELAALVRLVPYGRQESADAHSAKLADLISSLGEMAARAAGNVSICWRCGANLSPPDRSTEAEIEANAKVAEWSGWNRVDFASRARQTLQSGDRIVKLDVGSFLVRRPDGSTLRVYRLEA